MQTPNLKTLRFQNGVLFYDAADLMLRLGGIPLTTSCCTGLAAPTAGQVLAWDAVLKTYKPTTAGGSGVSNLTATTSSTTYVVANSNGTGFTIPLGTSTVSGLLSPTQFTQIANAQPLLVSATNIKTVNGISLLGSGDLPITGVATNLAIGTVSNTTQSITNSNGTGFILSGAGAASAGLLTAAQFTQLSSLPTGAIQTANSVTGNGGATPITLVNDVAVPTNTQYYGTNAAAARGWYNLPPVMLDKYNAGAGVMVSADAATITASKSAGVFTINVPAGVHCSFIDVNALGTDIQSGADGSGATNWINIIINSVNVGGSVGVYKLPSFDGYAMPVGIVSVINTVFYTVTNQALLNVGINTVTFRKANMTSANDYVITIKGV